MNTGWTWPRVALGGLMLVVLAALLLAGGEEQAPDAPTGAPVDVAQTLAAVESGETGKPLTAYQEMIDRPLFSSTRRPPALSDEPQQSLDGQQLREAWRLSGIAMQQGRQLASFSERQGEGRFLLEIGMALADEWRLEQIGADFVLLGNGAGGEVRLPLREPVVHEDKAEPRAPADKTIPASAPAAPSQ